MFDKLLKAVVNIAITPVDVVKDVATMGGILTDQDDLYTIQRARKIIKNISDANKELEKWLD